MKKQRLVVNKSFLFTQILFAILTCVLPTEAGVLVGASVPIESPDYSDSFNVNTVSRPGVYHHTPWDAIDTYYNVESGSPVVQWHPTGNFSFNVHTNTIPEYPGNAGNAGAATGMAQSGGKNANFAYGVRDTFVVQVDATFVNTDHIRLGTYANVGDQSGAANSLEVRFRRGSTGIGLANTKETATGFTTGIDAADTSWHNFAVEFNKSANTISLFVDQVLRGTLDLKTFAGGIYQTYSNEAVGMGVSGRAGWFDNFQVGAPKGFIDATLIDVDCTENIHVTSNNAITTLINSGKVIKKGSGTLNTINAHLVNGMVEVEEGTLEIGSGVSDLPSALQSDLVFWVDANRNVEINDGVVTCWNDVRKDFGGVSWPMARQFVSTNDVADPAPLLVRGGDDVFDLNLIDFGAYGCGRWLQWQDTMGNRLSIPNIRTVFMVVSCTNGTGFLLGDWDNTSTNSNEGTHDFHVGGAVYTGNPAGEALRNATWWGEASGLPAVVFGRTFINGEFICGAEQKVSTTGELMSLVTIGNAQASNFGNNRNYKASQGITNVEIDRQGGGRIGEVLIYTSVLSESRRLQVESYLMKKWFKQGVGTLRIAENATVTLRADATNNLSNAKIAGAGTLNVWGAGALNVFEMPNPSLPSIHLNVGAGINSGTLYQRTYQPYTLEGGSVYNVSNGITCRQSLADGSLIEKTGDGVLTASTIAPSVKRISIKAGALRFVSPQQDAIKALTNSLENASFETFISIGTGGDSNWGYTPTGTGWAITDDFTSTKGAEWSAIGMTKCLANTPWCAGQSAPDGEWCVFIKRAGELERTFTVPLSGCYEITFFTAARPQRINHLYQVLVDTTNVIGSVRNSKTTFSKITCVTPPLAAGTHTLCFKGIYGDSDCASVIDNIVITRRNTLGYRMIPNSGFEEQAMPAVDIGGSNHYFAYNPVATGWNFIPNPAVTNSGITSGNNAWHYKELEEGGQAAFLRQTGGMSTSATFPTAGVYRLSFQAAAREGYWADVNYFKGFTGHDFKVTLNGTLITRVTTQKLAFDDFSFVLPVIEEGDPLIQTLTFTGLNSMGGDRASLIDTVSICGMPALANPGFETSATLANGTWEAGIQDAGWLFDVGEGERNQSGIAQSGSGWCNTTPEGGCNAFLQMKAQISQTVTFGVSGTYELSFLAAGRSKDTRFLNHDFQVNFAGLKVGYIRTADSTFRRYSFKLPCVKANVPYRLVFEGVNHGDSTDRASFIDSVMLTKVEDAVPDTAVFTKIEIALAAGTSLELDYNGLVTMEHISYNGQSYSGVLTKNNTPFIQGSGEIYVVPQGTIIITK